MRFLDTLQELDEIREMHSGFISLLQTIFIFYPE